ncbi:N-acetylmuramoyl-L-alanine amidase family protein [Flavobacterium restrictum]|uniref:N-acetylmuramoyl-L-alanine amidase n=1 Tax=Flavobacterium restrictum TaxID=2594428 RepID=A0A553E7T0_9FLAO|nr:N-acetylmuramoyl-L-alanine amidase [Flavobacterium restrictum]TRX40883.1 N-acetylmuramoyl-L-alanine amidase [Flavobacterium restrictum]
MLSKKEFKARITLLFTVFGFAVASFAQSGSKFIVVLDAGHGGHDSGAHYNGHIEKDITLEVILRVGKILEQNSSISLIYTRKTDEFIELRERAKIANRANANLFVSVHCNANRNSGASGSETYVMGMSRANMNFEVSKAENSVIFLEDNYKKTYKGFDPNNPETLIGLKIVQENNLTSSIDLANKVQNNFSISSEIKSRGIKQEPIWVLDATVMPGVLIETGFVSSPSDAEILESESGQQQIAQSIAGAIISYKNEYFGGDASDNIEIKPAQRRVEIADTTAPIKIKATIDTPKIGRLIPIEIKEGVVFKVQLSASYKKLDLEPKNFKGLQDVTVEQETKLYKYLYGETDDYQEAKDNLKEAKSKGYNSAFLIALKDGKKVSIQEALK